MKSEYIKEFSGKIIGILETASNGDQTIKSFPSQKILGYYRAKRNVTTDFHGKILSRGNTVTSLLYTQNN